MSDATLKKIKEVVAEKLGHEKDDIKLESQFVEDLGADSLDIVELLMSIEEEFSIDIPDEEATTLLTVKDTLDYIEKYL
uniref:Acyl carrier protein n=1 Tax=Pleonosporium borreri TaxID=2575635 RepID=A0A4D6WWU5_9FLOR|nr:Acyl carrier protein [Pleonosporium borreri]